MEFSEVVRRRRMVRRHDPEPIPDDQLGRIVETARHAPSAGFTQGQSFVIVTDPGLRRRIAELAGEGAYRARGFDPWLSEAPALVIVCTSEQAYRDRYREPDKLGPEGRLEWPVPFWYVDAGCSMMLLLLAAVDEGLAAGFLAMKSYDGLRALLGIPASVQPIGIVTIGKPAPDRRSGSLSRGRKPAGEVIHREHWGADVTDISAGRAPFQVLVFPFLPDKDGFIYGLFRRADGGYWQGLSGGGEGDEMPMEAARRESSEEAGIPTGAKFVGLDTRATIPVVSVTGDLTWGPDVPVIPEYCFGVQVDGPELTLSHEHTDYGWFELGAACSAVRWDSNRTALWELDHRLRRGL